MININSSRDKTNFKKVNSVFQEKVILINRITKVVKGGRRLRFSALVVVGDKKGRVGFASAKAQEILDAIKKALEKAKNNLVTIPLSGTTIPHEVIGEYGASKTLIKPVAKGKGIIAGGAARTVFELVGIRDISAKSLGSRTPINTLRALMIGLQKLRTIKDVEKTRGINLIARFKGKQK
uniref:Small ribosomal subunit protein uS5 n=3 Tax=Candidatus Phytoplasma TaxID=33926 RepID=I6UW02_PHYVT|nr:ribosomal protein S5 [Candidatus Phytoplasma vitis]AFN02575.1 ribosomal protein S5 [Candidatus Phytoplasma vitis]AFN02605.1 ribosomal protein S5 ['Vitis vinifera' yellows phytoplasma]